MERLFESVKVIKEQDIPDLFHGPQLTADLLGFGGWFGAQDLIKYFTAPFADLDPLGQSPKLQVAAHQVPVKVFRQRFDLEESFITSYGLFVTIPRLEVPAVFTGGPEKTVPYAFILGNGPGLIGIPGHELPPVHVHELCR